MYVHIQVFWILPISGNLKLYKKPFCDENMREGDFDYGCFNFKSSTTMIVYYCLWLVYFWLSAEQLRYGFPLEKVYSSVCSIQADMPGPQLASAYMQIPFAVEIRCLIDYLPSKTSLDHFQFFQCYGYYVELYMARWNNDYYHRMKVFGREVTFDNKIQGCVCMLIFMSLVVGPFLFFSEMLGFTENNPVLSAEIDIGFQVNKTVSRWELITKGHDTSEWFEDEAYNNQIFDNRTARLDQEYESILSKLP